MEEFEKLAQKILEFCEKEKASVSREPRNETERGFKIATMLMVVRLNSLILREKAKRNAHLKTEVDLKDIDLHDAESFKKLLEDKLKEHGDEE